MTDTLRQLDAWLPVLDTLIETAPPGTELAEVVGRISSISQSLTYLADGRTLSPAERGPDAASRMYQALDRLDRALGDRNLPVVLRAAQSGLREVQFKLMPSGAHVDIFGQDLEVQLVDKKIPYAKRQSPGTYYLTHRVLTNGVWKAPAPPASRNSPFPPPPPAGTVLHINDRSGLTMADVTDDTQVVRIGVSRQLVPLGALAGHPRVHALSGRSATMSELEILVSLPALEYLELDAAGWTELLTRDLVPTSLLAAGITAQTAPADGAAVLAERAAMLNHANTLLARWDRPLIETVTLSA